MFNKLKASWRLAKFSREWRKRNLHNETSVGRIFNPDLVTVGNYSYGNLDVLMFDHTAKLKIGNFCSIAPGVKFIVSADHYLSHVSTFPFKVKVTKTEENEAISKGDINVGDDVWIGGNAIILSGINIGQGAVIAAGAVVTKDVDPYAIVGGSPAHLIKKRFNDETIGKLLRIDYSKLSSEMIIKHIDDLYSDLTDIERVEWMPKK